MSSPNIKLITLRLSDGTALDIEPDVSLPLPARMALVLQEELPDITAHPTIRHLVARRTISFELHGQAREMTWRTLGGRPCRTCGRHL